MLTLINENTSLNPIEQNSANLSLVSKNYGFIDTKIVQYELEKLGFILEKTVINKVRKPEKLGYQRHRLVFNHPDFFIDPSNKFQLLVQNSHDGSESLRLNLGVYRLICANGLIKGDTKFSIKIKHSKNSINEFLRNIEFFISQINTEKDKIVAMQNKQLNKDQINDLKNKVFDLKFGQFIVDKTKENKKVIVELDTIDTIRRIEDQNNDLYSVLNRIQESIIRGGIKYQIEQNNTVKNFSTRKVNSIKENTRLNQELFNLADQLLVA